MKTVLEMVQAAQAELGLPVDTTVFGGAASNTGVQMAALANRCLDEMRRMARWTAMQFEYNLVVDVPISTTGDMVAQSAVITNIPDTSSLEANFWAVSGEGIAQAARIASVDSATQITMTMENTNTENATDVELLFMKDTYPIPSDFDWFNNRTMWDRTNRWELLGPDSPQLDQWHRSGIVATGPRRHFRKLGPYTNVFRIWPPPGEITSPLQLVFEYLSLNAVLKEGFTLDQEGAFQQYFTDDGDIPLLDDQAIIMGIKWMFFEIKGFGSYVTLQNRWIDYINQMIARDGAAPTLNLAQRVNPIFISPANVQDGFYPGPVGPNTG